nr:MAG TPA: hypothetical protein [Caudoviricetes sp.]
MVHQINPHYCAGFSFDIIFIRVPFDIILTSIRICLKSFLPRLLP